MDFCILGPLEVWDDGRLLVVRGARRRALLVALVLRAGEVVPIDRLIDDLWGEGAPPTATHAVRVHVGEVRKILRTAEHGEERLITRPSGYLLKAAPEEIDLRQFERLLARGRGAFADGDATAASATIAEALALWRGPAFADLGSAPVAERELPRLEELRLSALEDRIEADLVLGRYEGSVGEIRGLVKEHPFRERLRAQLMTALYGSGRQVEALAAYQDARSFFAEEFGIDPSRELQELATSILREEAIAGGGGVREAARPSAHPPTGGHMSRKPVTVLSVGMEVSTASGGVPDAEPLGILTARLLEEVEAAAARHGGLVLPSTGEAVFVVFGVPRVHEDDALRAVRAAAEVRTALPGPREEAERVGLVVTTRLGVDSGEVLSDEGGLDGSVVTGDVMGAAVRLQRAASPDDVLIGERTLRLVAASVKVEPVALADGSNPIRTVFRPIEVAMIGEGVAPRMRSPMVGRRAELAILRSVFERAVRDPGCRLVSVLGGAGVGKTRLLEEFMKSLASEASVLTGRCLPYGEGITFRPISEVVRRTAGIEPGDGPRQVRDKIEAIVRDDQDAALLVERIAHLLGSSTSPASPGETVWSVRRFLEILAAERPLVVVVEDLHFAEPMLFDLIEHIVDRSRNVPIMLVCTARTELLEARPGWHGRSDRVQAISLEPLDDAEAAVLLENLLGGVELAAEVRSHVLGAAEGNPLFVEQLLSMLIDDGFIRRHDERWVPTRELTTLPIPRGIQAVLAARIDRLGWEQRLALECASIVGREFGRFDVEALAPADVAEHVGDLLLGLVQKDLVRLEGASELGDTYRFAHVLVWNATYDSIPKQVRADLHERFAEWMEGSTSVRAPDEESLGYHLAQASRYRVELTPGDERGLELGERAGRYLASAGDRAFARGDMPGAMRLLTQASSLLPPGDRQRLRFLPELGTSLVELGDMATAGKFLDEAIQRSSACGDESTKARALFYRSELSDWTGVEGRDDALSEAERMIPSLEAREDHLALSYCWRIVAACVRVDAWAEALERARSHAQLAGDRTGQLEIVQYLAAAALSDDTPAEAAIRRCEELIDLAEGDRLTEAAVLINGRGPLLAMVGRFDEARRDIATARAIFEDLGLALWLAAAGAFFLADVEMLAGDPAAAELALRRGLEALEEMKAPAVASAEAGFLARVLYEQSRFDEAEEFETVALLAEEREPDYYIGRGTRARLLARTGRTQEAIEVARSGVEAAVRYSNRVRADELMALADVLRLADKPEEAAAAANEALELYERKGNVVLAARARRSLRELAILDTG